MYPIVVGPAALPAGPGEIEPLKDDYYVENACFHYFEHAIIRLLLVLFSRVGIVGRGTTPNPRVDNGAKDGKKMENTLKHPDQH